MQENSDVSTIKKSPVVVRLHPAQRRDRGVRRQGVLNIDIYEHIVYTIYGEGGTLFLLKVPTSAFTF